MMFQRLVQAVLLAATILVACVEGDIYLHNPRGSNNRLNEGTRARANGNSLFDSQNNNRGGYNVGAKMHYYQGSKLNIQWTNQHSCNNPNSNCEVILQYMCSDYVRDGQTTRIAPITSKKFDVDPMYRMHEKRADYMSCYTRERNKGLFTADQKLNTRNSATITRQNKAGTRRGYECPEERDYYPYWHKSPWRDIAVLTNNVSRCDYYKRESQNVKERYACRLTPLMMSRVYFYKVVMPNNKEDCEKYVLPKQVYGKDRKAKWTKLPSHGIPAPDCRQTEFSRDNHHGNTYGGQPISYEWTIPKYLKHENCVLRIRYNISTSDYDGWNTDSTHNAVPSNMKAGSRVPISSRVELDSEEEAKKQGYVLKNNPVVKLFDGLDMDLKMAVNTAQFGRTFQDRTHTFAIRSRPASLENATIHNLNVRGKRGNIVQVYPAVEYDFVPNDLKINQGDFVHIQWTGSNNNPRNNDGEGKKGTDRNNIILLANQVYPEGNATGNTFYTETKYGHYGRNYPMKINGTNFLGLANQDALRLALNDPEKVRDSKVGLLDEVTPYFNMNPMRADVPGVFHYMCTRNNNFSNRDQKGRVTVVSN